MEQGFSQLQFTLPEILSLIGLIQCIYIMVYMAFRAGGLRHAAVPFAYFFILASAFFSDFAARAVEQPAPPYYAILQWALWSLGPPVSVLLMIQVARLGTLPGWRYFLTPGLIPFALIAAVGLNKLSGTCPAFTDCPSFRDWLSLTGFLGGLASVGVLWLQRLYLEQLSQQPSGKDRYWLVLALVVADLCYLATILLGMTDVLGHPQAAIIRTIWGLGFVYLAGTSLFRIYPQAVQLVERGGTQKAGADDARIAEQIKTLLTLDKVYHEQAYNRVNLAKELGVSETVVSRVVNQAFGKTLPQLLNEFRIGDARQLLRETDAPIKTIAEEVGFNSIASFNRAFRESEGISPSQFREQSKIKKAADSL